MNLGDKLKYNRELKGFSQEQIAKYLNVSRQSISRWENNNCYPDMFNIVKLSEYYNISVNELVNKESTLSPTPQNKEAIKQNEKDEGLLLLILSVVSLPLYPIGILTSPIIAKKNKPTNTMYKLIYFINIVCIVFQVYLAISYTKTKYNQETIKGKYELIERY